MKRYFLAIAMLAALACPWQARGGENITLRFSWWGGSARHEATLAVIKMFEEQNPGVTIKGEYMGWNGYLERLTTQISGSSEPDIMQMDWAWLALFSKRGDGFYNLSNLGQDIVNTAAYDQKWLDQATVDGKLNALPVSFTTQFFLWNKTIFDKAGAAIPKTWDDFIAAGETLKEKLGDDYYANDMNRNQTIYMTHTWIFQKTGRMYINPETNKIDLSVDEIEDWMKFYLKLNESHALVPLDVRASRSGDSNSLTQEQPDFVEGHWAGSYTWDSSIGITLSTPPKEFEFVLGEYLTMPDAKSTGRIGRPAQIMAVSKNSKHPEMAAKFISFMLTSPEAARVLKTTRGVLIAKPSYEELVSNDLVDPIMQEAVDQIADIRVYNPSPYYEDPRMLKLLNDTIEEVAYKKISPREGAETLHREGERILRRLNR